LGVEKVEALVYIYTNNRLLRQRPCADPIRYYDENIFSKDSDDDSGALSETNDNDNDNNNDNDDNNGNGGEGHDGSNLNSSDRGGEHCGANLPIFLGNQHLKAVYDWNEIDEEIANGVDKHAAVGPIRNMHVDEDAPVCSVDCAYDRADEESDDDDYDKVANEHSEENGNAHGQNGNGNNCGEGGATGAAVSCNNDAASVASGDGGSSNVLQEGRTEEAPNQGVEIQDNPLDVNVNSQVPNVVIPVVNNKDEKDNAPLNYMYTSAT
jgi:hypothetical protein